MCHTQLSNCIITEFSIIKLSSFLPKLIPLLHGLLWEATDWQLLFRLLWGLEFCCRCPIHTLVIGVSRVSLRDVCLLWSWLPLASWLLWIRSGSALTYSMHIPAPREVSPQGLTAAFRGKSFLHKRGHHGSLLKTPARRPHLCPTGSESACNKIPQVIHGHIKESEAPE